MNFCTDTTFTIQDSILPEPVIDFKSSLKSEINPQVPEVCQLQYLTFQQKLQALALFKREIIG
ncbi:hypothetical protein [Salmonella enterica]|uniref:Uncharacterized protein n=1 Tax=Salmonella enterica I TaxID=59201 RepID=A0A8F6XX80_SALET|nr:hypothetical protein [Salmonella enterica]EAU9426549.1 hypothetical protein [Salmonella enterica]PUO48624.1 hypothetical protein DAY10_02925 [Salmonella enterica subsp. enterica]PUO62527.1 hypothetical protein DAX55_19430 [Salmonella enterica subsp. enterica]PUQ10911.1 hypothetical protein DAX99_24930 [Salmonella enterica subsp. enterica]QXR78205.1 hypothetical protein DAX88_004275 [Salmonella enterica subsp. enterica]